MPDSNARQPNLNLLNNLVMKIKTIIGLLVLAALAATGGWFAGQHWQRTPKPALDHTSAGRKILYYQSAMHPWIKSDKPGRCTICGMELTPVYEGERGFDVAEGLVTLNSNSVNVLHVQTAEIRRQPLQRTLRVAGVIEEDDTRHRLLSAYVDGRIDKLAVNYVGAEVEQGQPLATLYSTMLLTAQREYLSTVRQKEAAVSAELRTLDEQLLASAAQRLRQLGLSDQQIQALPQKKELGLHTDILAPISGTVVARYVYEGQYVKEGEKLFEIADFSTLWFQFDAYERDLAWLRIGAKVDVTTPAAPGAVFSGAITFIDPNIKEMTRSAKVRVEIPNPLIEENGRRRRQLFRKLFAEGVVKVDLPQVLAVPRSAVLSPGQETFVYVDKQSGAYEQRRVRLGRASDEFWEVLDGLAEGERVVTMGNLLIDAQAQLNRSGAGFQAAVANVESPTPRNSGTNTALDSAQQKTAQSFLKLASAVTRALSKDQLDEFNREAAKLHAALPELMKAFEVTKAWHPILEKIEASGHLESAADLAAARKEFFPFSQAVVEFARQLRSQEPEFKSMKIYQCPMANQAVPGAPKVGLWVQSQGPLQNPFFGAEMLDCGSEVKP